MKHSSGSPLEGDVSAESRGLATAVQWSRLAESRQVELHPVWPVTTVTAIDKEGTFQVDGSTGNNRCFLIIRNSDLLAPLTTERLSNYNVTLHMVRHMMDKSEKNFQ